MAAIASGTAFATFGVIAPRADAAPTESAQRAQVQGIVEASGKPVAGAAVSLYIGSTGTSSKVASTTSSSSGAFTLSYTPPTSGVVYVMAAPSKNTTLLLLGVVGEVDSGNGVATRLQSTVTVNERTTVAATYALAQFITAQGIAGPSPGLENAAATTFNLVTPQGSAGPVVTDEVNGSHNDTDTLATLNTLANLVALCGNPSARACQRFLRLSSPPGAPVASNTLTAIENLAKNPTLSLIKLFDISLDAATYQPALKEAATEWMLVLVYTDQNLYASGRIAIDSDGNVWSSNNWLPGTKTASPYVTVLSPVGNPILGSPISGGGMKGGAWGAAIAPNGSVWFGSFGGSAMSEISRSGTPMSPDSGYTQGNLNHPQGVAVDQRGNVWIANNYGPKSAPGQGDVVVYPGGDPTKAITITGGGLNHPFAIQIDGQGRAWVTNAGEGGARLVNTRAAILVGKFSGSVTVIGTDFKPTPFSPITNKSFKWPLGLALDSKGDAWAANYFSSTVTEVQPNGRVAGVFALPRLTSPWSEAVDGSDRVWVAGFVRPGVWLLCGANHSACPTGSKTGTVLSPRYGFRSGAFQHFTSIQIDESGNIWLSNNWSKLKPVTGGVGIAEIIGVATPVCTPLTPLPVKPSSVASGSCAQ